MKTSDLSGSALDWAVAKCEPDDTLGIYFDDQTGEALVHDDWPDFQQYTPPTNWAQGGPIIERECIELSFLGFDEIDEALPIWHACKYVRGVLKEEQGHTPLIAAMRCFVASKLGEIVEVPDAIAQL